jgi:hypothetical protein
VEINEFSVKFKEVDMDLLKDISKIESKDEKEILRIIE